MCRGILREREEGELEDDEEGRKERRGKIKGDEMREKDEVVERKVEKRKN